MLAEIANAPISDLTLREPARARATDPLRAVVALMRELGRGAVIVEDDDRRLCGIFTERDLMRRVDHADHAWYETAVGEVMTASPVALTLRDTVADALKRMHAGTMRNLPVVDADGRAAGILTIRDLLSHIVEFFPAEFLNLPPDPAREAHRRWGG